MNRMVRHRPRPSTSGLDIYAISVNTARPSAVIYNTTGIQTKVCMTITRIGACLPGISLAVGPQGLHNIPSTKVVYSLSRLKLRGSSRNVRVFNTRKLTINRSIHPLLNLSSIVLSIASATGQTSTLDVINVTQRMTTVANTPLRLPPARTPTFRTDNSTPGVSLPSRGTYPVCVNAILRNVSLNPSPR